MGLAVVGGPSLFVSHDGQTANCDAGGARSPGTSGVVVVLPMARESQGRGTDQGKARETLVTAQMSAPKRVRDANVLTE